MHKQIVLTIDSLTFHCNNDMFFYLLNWFIIVTLTRFKYITIFVTHIFKFITIVLFLAMVYYIFNAVLYSVTMAYFAFKPAVNFATMVYFTLITVVDYVIKEYFTLTTVVQCRLCYNGKVDIYYSSTMYYNILLQWCILHSYIGRL